MEYLSVASIALFEFWLAYPAAYAFKMPWEQASALIALASSVGALLTIFVGAQFRSWVTRKVSREGRIVRRTKRFLDKGGTVGLGLLAPWILGPILTSLGALALGANERQLARWMVAGIWVWAVGLYVLIKYTGSMDWMFAIAR
jgi:hypothetical protein